MAPPSTGPTQLPNAQAPWTVPYHFGRWRRGTISVKMTRLRTMMPPPPIPWTERPPKSVAISGATAQMMEPIVNIKMEKIKRIGRPNMSDIEARNGIATDVDSRYAVPTQKLWVAVPPRSSTIACIVFLSVQSGVWSRLWQKNCMTSGWGLTLSEVTMIHASSDTMKLMTLRATMIISWWVVGFHSVSCRRDSSTTSSLPSGCCLLSRRKRPILIQWWSGAEGGRCRRWRSFGLVLETSCRNKMWTQIS